MGIVRPVMVYFPQAWIFFVPFIIITSFAVLNLFIGIIVDAMQASRQDDRENASAAASTGGNAQELEIQLQRQLDELTENTRELSETLKRLKGRG